MRSHKAPRNFRVQAPLEFTPAMARFDARHINNGFAAISRHRARQFNHLPCFCRHFPALGLHNSFTKATAPPRRKH